MRLLALTLTITVLLVAAGTGYARWATLVHLSGHVSTGEVDIEFTCCTCNDPTNTVDPGHDKDVGWCDCQLVDTDEDGDADLVRLRIANGYPGYRCEFEVTVRNNGTIPVRIVETRLLHDYDVDVIEIGGSWVDGSLLGTQLDPGESDSGVLQLHVKQAASQNMDYTFTLEIEAVQWNEAESPSGAQGYGPDVVCMWETDMVTQPVSGQPLLEDGDPLHETPGAQFLPPLRFDAAKEVGYWVIVKHPMGAGCVDEVKVDVYHPPGSPGYGSMIHRIALTKVDKAALGIPSYQAARDAGLVAYQAGYDSARVSDDLSEGRAGVYVAQGHLDGCAPAGDYRVAADACGSDGLCASHSGTGLENHFTYLAASGIEIDFESLDYGSVEVGAPKWIRGDAVWDQSVDAAPDPNPATIRNIGNTDVSIAIVQDDMGFGYSGTDDDREWNVGYGARLGGDPCKDVYYDPYQDVILPNKLALGAMENVDLLICVRQTAFGIHTGNMTIGCLEAAFEP